MIDLNDTKPYGVFLDTTLKVIKQDLIRRFKENSIDLTPEQWTILAGLAHKEFVFQSELAQNTFKDAPTVSRIIELLRKRGFIYRKEDQDDRRRFMISLTREGHAIFSRSAPLVHEARKVGWIGLNDNDYEELNRILKRIADNILNANGQGD